MDWLTQYLEAQNMPDGMGTPGMTPITFPPQPPGTVAGMGDPNAGIPVSPTPMSMPDPNQGVPTLGDSADPTKPALQTSGPLTPGQTNQNLQTGLTGALRGLQAAAPPQAQKVATPHLPQNRSTIQGGDLIQMMSHLGITPQMAMQKGLLQPTLMAALGGH